MISKVTALEVYNIVAFAANRKKMVKQLAKQRNCSTDTIKRYYRYGAESTGAQVKQSTVMSTKDRYIKKLQEMPEEILKAFVHTGSDIPKRHTLKKITLPKKSFKIGFFTDPHMGSKFFREDWWDSMVEDFNENEVDVVLCSGDITEGLYSHRKGHVFELAYLGYVAQRDFAIKMLRKIQQPFYTIAGNHDLTYTKDVNVDIVDEICKNVPNATYLGVDNADVCINGIIVRLFHGLGGSAYALSYSLQKKIETIPGGDKPHLLLSGHTHKSFYMPAYRNIECFSGGAMCEQSDWMAATLKGNHSGYWVINVEHNKSGIHAVSGRFRPFFLESIEKNSINL